MRTAALLLCLALAVPALAADDKPWPQRGDTVFVSAVLPAVSMPTNYGNKMPDLAELPACSPIDVGFHTAKRIGGTDASGGTRILDGEWARAIFASEGDCRRAPAVRVKVDWRYDRNLAVYRIAAQ